MRPSRPSLPSGPSGARSSEPLRSGRLQADPAAQAYLLRRAGQDILVTLEEARQWFQQGYTILDPNTRTPVDIGGVPIPSYAGGQGAFVNQQEIGDAVRNALAEEGRKDDEKTEGINGGGSLNGFSGGSGRNGGPGPTGGSNPTSRTT